MTTTLQLDKTVQMEISNITSQMFIKPEPERNKVRTYSSISDIEHELEDVLLNTILNHEIFVRNIPLNIEIIVSKKIQSEIENKELNVKLRLDPDITIENEGENLIHNSEDIKQVLFDQKEYFEKVDGNESKNAKDTGEHKPRLKEADTDNVCTQNQVTKDPENGKKKFTLEQDKEILDKVVIMLPGKSLANLELSENVLDGLSIKLARSPSSIHHRWKYSLRTWLVQFFSKNHRSWSKNLSVKASVERRKQVVKYFNKLSKQNRLKIEVMNATKII